MGDFVAGEDDALVSAEAGCDHVAESVVFFIEGEDGC